MLSVSNRAPAGPQAAPINRQQQSILLQNLNSANPKRYCTTKFSIPESSSKISWQHHKARGCRNRDCPPRWGQPGCRARPHPTASCCLISTRTSTKLSQNSNDRESEGKENGTLRYVSLIGSVFSETRAETATGVATESLRVGSRRGFFSWE